MGTETMIDGFDGFITDKTSQDITMLPKGGDGKPDAHAAHAGEVDGI